MECFVLSSNKVLGGMFIVAGTTIGGGMLALPLASASAGFGASILILVFMWALMTYTALITLEMNLHFHKGVSISYAAEHILGPVGKIVSTVTIGVLFYALLSAYMAGGASIVKQIIVSLLGIELSTMPLVLLFGVIFSSIIFLRTQAVDTSNRWLLMLKAVCFLIVVMALLPAMDLTLLHYTPTTLHIHFPVLIPLLFTSFGFHGSIPTIVNYVGADRSKLRFTFVLGSAIPLLVYILWEAVTLGVILMEGAYSFSNINNQGGDVGIFTKTLATIAGGGWFVMVCQGFTFLAIATSFLGVGIGFFDFIEEQLARKLKSPSPYITWALTFIIPGLFALFYPKGFVIALGYASIALSILAIIIPSLVVWKLRCAQVDSNNTTLGGRWGLLFALLAGTGIILLELTALLS